MMKRLFLVLGVVGLLTLLLALPTREVRAADYVPIQVNASAEPKTLTGPSRINVAVRVVNVADGDLSDAVKLYDPNGSLVQEWSSLKQGASVTYNGSWDVSQEELNDGKVKYKVSYYVYDEETGAAKGASMVVSVPVSKASVSAKLVADYSISPATANKGQTVTFTYTLSNTGNIAVTNVQVTNTGVSDDKVNISSIAAGEKVTRTVNITMGSKALSSYPKVTYRAEGSDTVLSITNMAKKTVELAQSGLTVNLAASGATEVMPGEKVDLTCTVQNTGNVNYTNLRITDASLGEILSGVDLKPAGKLVEPRRVTVDQTTDYTFVVTADDSTGSQISIPSNTVTLIAIDTSKLLQLDVSAEASKSFLSQRPELVTFTIRVANVGQATGTEIVVRHGNTTIASVPGELPPGEERIFVKEIEASMEGTYEFTASGKGEQGISETFSANQIVLPFVEPTPVPPPPTPEPILAVETATPEPTPEVKESAFSGGWLLYAGIGLLALLLVLVLVIVLLRRRNLRGNRGGKGGDDSDSYDSFEIRTRRDYLGTQKRRKGASRSHGDPDDEDDDEVSLYDEPLYGDGDLPDEAALAAAQAELMEDGDPDAYSELYARPKGVPPRGEKRRRPLDEDEEEYEDGETPYRRPRTKGEPEEEEISEELSRWRDEAGEEAPTLPREETSGTHRREGRTGRRARGNTGKYMPPTTPEDDPETTVSERPSRTRRERQEPQTETVSPDREETLREETPREGWESAYPESTWAKDEDAPGPSALRQDTGYYRLQRSRPKRRAEEREPKAGAETPAEEPGEDDWKYGSPFDSLDDPEE